MLHQAEKYIKQIVEEIGRPSYMQEFLKQGKDKKAIEDVIRDGDYVPTPEKIILATQKKMIS